MMTTTSYGSARWATAKEIQRSSLVEGDGVILGMADGSYLRASGDSHVMLVGPSRSGKDVSVVTPTLLSWPYSVIVLDIKGESFKLTGAYRETLGPVYRFNPTSSDGHRLNVLDSIRPEFEIADADRLASNFAAPQAPPTAATEYWQDENVDMLATIFLYLLHQDEYPRSCAGALALMCDPNRSIMPMLRHMMGCHHPVVRMGVQQLINLPATKRAEVWSGGPRFLRPWRDPKVARNTDATDIPIAALQQSDRPISIYLQVTAEDLNGRFRRLFRVLLQQVLGRLIDRDVDQYKQPLLLVMNEVAQLGHMWVIKSAVELVAGYGILVLLVLQSLEQLWNAYGEHNSIIGNCPIKIIYAPAAGDWRSAEIYERMLGVTTVEDSSTRRSRGRWSLWWQSQGEMTHHHARPLLTAAEIVQLPRNQAIVMAQGMPPILAKKNAVFSGP